MKQARLRLYPATQVHLLRRGRYHRVLRSGLFPALDLQLLASCLDELTMTRAIRKFRQALARPGRPARRSRR